MTDPQTHGSSEENSTAVAAKCHCGQLTASATVSSSALPLPLWLCSCDSCRFSSGQIAITCAFLPPASDRSSLHITGQATRYKTSEGPSALIRCFCPKCGAFVYEDSPDPNRQSLYGGALTETTGIVEVKGITFNGDARDGGLAPCLPQLKAWDGQKDGGAGSSSPAWESSIQTAQQGGPHVAQSYKDGEGKPELLLARCHCARASFNISRPTPASSAMSLNLEGLFYPSLTTEEWPENEWDIKWWVRGDRKDRYAAVLCTCDSCRRSSGFDVQAWAFVPAVNMHAESGAQLRIPEDLVGLSVYESSPGVNRYFCGTCGAKVFFRAEERMGLVDVSVGLLRAESGSRAEEWLEWGPKLSHGAEARNKHLGQALDEGVRKRFGENADKR